MHWFLLALAILSEVVGTVALKMSNGMSVGAPSLVVILGYLSSFWFLALSLKTLDVGTAYAIWAGVGIALVSVASMLIFKETMTALKVFSIALIVIGVFGLNWGRNASV